MRPHIQERIIFVCVFLSVSLSLLISSVVHWSIHELVKLQVSVQISVSAARVLTISAASSSSSGWSINCYLAKLRKVNCGNLDVTSALCPGVVGSYPSQTEEPDKCKGAPRLLQQ